MINNKKANAIKILKKCLSEIEDPKNISENWIKQTADFLRLFLGEDSELYKSMIGRSSLLAVDLESPRYKMLQGEHFGDVVRRAIQIVEANGIYKQPKKENWFEQIPADWAVFIIGGLIAVGVFIQKASDKYLPENNESKVKSETILGQDTNKVSHPDSNQINKKK